MLPVVHRELVTAARHRSTYTARLATAGFALLALAWMYLFAGLTGSTAARGQELFATLTIFAFIYSLFIGAWLTADCISAEKRESTLGLLFLTDLRGFDIILGKLASSSIASFYGLLAIVPLLALAILLGGVTLNDVARVALLLTNTMFFSLAIGLLVSTVSQNERKALFATVLVIFAITVLPVAIVGIVQEVFEIKLSDTTQALGFLPSPILTVMTSPIGPGQPAVGVSVSFGFFTSVSVIHLEAWLFVWLASRWLPRVAHERPKSVRRENLFRRWRQWSFGDGELRLRFRRRLLDQNAFYWLAARECRKPHYVWFALGIVLVMWLGSAWKYPRFFEDTEIWIVLAFIFHLLLKIWYTSEVCTRLHDDRHAGALELLLSTPLGVQDIACGQTAALRRQFLRPVLVVLVLDFILLVTAWNTQTFSSKPGVVTMIIAGMIVLPLDLFALKWVGMWRALTQAKLDRALLGTWLLVLTLPWLVFALIMSLFAYSQFVFQRSFSSETSGRIEIFMISLWALLGMVNSLVHAVRARRRFFAEFRTIAMARFDGPTPGGKIPLRAALAGLFRREQHAESGPRNNFLRRHPWWTAFACVVLSLAVSLMLYRFNAHRQLAREVAAIQKRGEPVSYDDLERFAPAIAPENNAAEKLMTLFPQVAPLYQFKPNPTKSNTGTLPRRGRLPDDYRRWYLQAMAGNSNVLEAVREIAVFPQSQFPISWRQFNNPNFVTQPFRVWWHTLQLSELINVKSLLSIDDGNQNEAVGLIELRFHLARLLGQEPIVAAHSSRLTIVGGGLEGMERLINAGPLSPALIHRLQSVLQAAETNLLDTASLRRALICERAVMLESGRESGEALATRALSWGPGGGRAPRNLVAFHEAMKLTGRWEILVAADLRTRSAEIELFNLPLQQRQRRALELEVERAKLDSRGIGQSVLTIFGRAPVGHMVLQQLSAIARVRAAQTALAIELWRSSTNADAPAKLEELVPQFLTQIPVDPFDDKPIRYARQKTGYIVYSVGRDGIDHHGQINSKVQRSEEPAFIMDR